jgi:NAD(P)-dependent dehydrogenase (short-subunit alcohol dehydrogenase family)
MLLDRFRLDGKVAIVTGASSGLGVEFARALAESGADVALGARRVDRLEAVRAEVDTFGRRVIAVATDVAKPEDCQALVDATVQPPACRIGGHNPLWARASAIARPIPREAPVTMAARSGRDSPF